MTREHSPHDDVADINTSDFPPPSPRMYWHGRHLARAMIGSFFGMLGLLGAAMVWGSYGWALVVLVPFVGGIVLGIWSEGEYALVWTASITTMGSVLGTLYMFNLAGVWCGLVAGVVMGVPLLMGAAVGTLYRLATEARGNREARRRRATLGLLFATTGLLWAEGQMPLPRDVETVRTSRILEASREVAWDNLVLYEEVGAEPPRLAKLGIPYPIGTEGEADKVGDIKRCLYEGGYLVKRITDHRPGVRFAFDVIEQQGIEDRSVVLIDGSFEFEEVEPGRTRVTLTTRYRPLLQARQVWKPFEDAVVHTLHNHVLDWMALQAN